MSDWRTPTFFIKRFEEALAMLCNGCSPPSNYITEWLDGTSDNLQDFCSENAAGWMQGIVVIDAALLLADNPCEGVNHEYRDAPI